MIVAELTARDDLRPLLAFFQRELAALGSTNHRFTLTNVKDWANAGLRWVTLEEHRRITAALGVSPVQTHQGRGYRLPYFLVAAAHPDKIRALDAMCLWGCNRIASEGAKSIHSQPCQFGSTAYADHFSGLTKGDPVTLQANAWIGTPQDVIKAILARRPEWQTSLSFTTAT